VDFARFRVGRFTPATLPRLVACAVWSRGTFPSVGCRSPPRITLARRLDRARSESDDRARAPREPPLARSLPRGILIQSTCYAAAAGAGAQVKLAKETMSKAAAAAAAAEAR